MSRQVAATCPLCFYQIRKLKSVKNSLSRGSPFPYTDIYPLHVVLIVMKLCTPVTSGVKKVGDMMTRSSNGCAALALYCTCFMLECFIGSVYHRQMVIYLQ